MVKPTFITWMMSPALVPGTGASNIAWCSFGSNRSPGLGSIFRILCFSKAETRSRWVSSIPSISPGALWRTASVTASSARSKLSWTDSRSRANRVAP